MTYTTKLRYALAVLGAIILIFSVNYWLINLGDAGNPERTNTWYVYGLWDWEQYKEFQRELEPYGITLQGKGCIIGSDEFKRDISSNQRLYDKAPEGLKQILKPSLSY